MMQFETNIELRYIVMVWLDKVQDPTLNESMNLTHQKYIDLTSGKRCTIPRGLYVNTQGVTREKRTNGEAGGWT